MLVKFTDHVPNTPREFQRQRTLFNLPGVVVYKRQVYLKTSAGVSGIVFQLRASVPTQHSARVA